MQSMPITSKVVLLSPAHGEVYLIQQYVKKYVSDLRQVSGFLRVPRFPSTIRMTGVIWYFDPNDPRGQYSSMVY